MMISKILLMMMHKATNNGTGEEDDFEPSVTLPYVYKQTFEDSKAEAKTNMVKLSNV